ncbi:MAG: hypothetical protein AAGG75_09420 [Bacteroidota bacterium]
MKIASQYTIISLFAILFVLSCTKPPDYPPEPVIEFKSLSKGFLTQGAFGDTLLLTISFTDGDGNIGDDENRANFILTDLRDGQAFVTFSAPLIPVQGANNGISGEISVIIDAGIPICCLYENGLNPCTPSADFPTDTVIYEVQIMDRDSNMSNIIQTDPIILRCL